MILKILNILTNILPAGYTSTTLRHYLFCCFIIILSCQRDPRQDKTDNYIIMTIITINKYQWTFFDAIGTGRIWCMELRLGRIRNGEWIIYYLEPQCRKIKVRRMFLAKNLTNTIKTEYFLKKGSKVCCCFCHILKLYQGRKSSQSEPSKHENSQQDSCFRSQDEQ